MPTLSQLVKKGKKHNHYEKTNKKKGITTHISCNALYNKFKGAYLIRSMLLLTKLFKASPFNMPF